VRIHSRARAIAALVVALVLSLPTAVSAQPSPPTDDLGSHVSHARAVAVLDAVRAAFSKRTSARTGSLPRTDLTMLLRDLRLAMPALTPGERTSANALLGPNIPPPSSNCSAGLLSGQVIATEHFCVHYPATTTDAWAHTTADTLEHVWSAEVDGLHFQHPPYDGDQLFDVTLEEIGDQGYYGACIPATGARHSTSSCILDDDFSPAEFNGAAAINSLRVTAAHEFFHAIQFGYDTSEDIWFMEGTAVWAEDQVYPDINDYLQYLPYSAITHPRTPADYNGMDGSQDLFFRYGAVLFWKFLSEQFHDPAIIRGVWEDADGSRYSLQAVTAALAERGWTFPRAFGRFGVWNTEPAGTYADERLYPAPVWWRTATLNRRHPGAGGQILLDHLTNAAMLLQPGARLPRRTRLRITVDAPALVRMPRAMVQLRRRDGSVTIRLLSLDSGGGGSRMVTFDSRVVRSVVVTLTNGSTRMTECGSDGGDLYSCAGQSVDDGLSFTVHARVKLP
jgi:hypothetical protein